MIIRRILPVLIGILMMSYCPLPVFAAESVEETDKAKGMIQVVLPAEVQEVSVRYAKIATWADDKLLQNNKIMDLLKLPITYDGNVDAECGRASIAGLTDGIYRLDIVGPGEYEFSPALVSIPMWSEEEKTMLYEVEVIPKYVYHEPVLDEEEVPLDVPESDPGKTEKTQSPKTGDESESVAYVSFGLISLIIVMIMSCHNRFRCGRMRIK